MVERGKYCHGWLNEKIFIREQVNKMVWEHFAREYRRKQEKTVPIESEFAVEDGEASTANFRDTAIHKEPEDMEI